MFLHAAWVAVLIASMWIATAASPQEEFVVRVWDTKSGLPQDAIKAIAQTPNGYLWVATFAGLARFDGDKFQIFDAGNTPELPDNLINALFCDRRGRLWIGHDSGLVTVMEEKKFRRVALPGDGAQVPIRSFNEDAEGNVWVMNLRWQLSIISPAGELLPSPAAPIPGDSWNHFASSTSDRNLRLVTTRGRCYIASIKGVTPDPDMPTRISDGRRVIHSERGGYWAELDGRLGRWMGGKLVEDAGPVNWGTAIYSIICEWNGMVAAGSFLDGLTLARHDGSRLHLKSPDDLPSNWIAGVFVDSGGSLWIGTGDGGIAAIWPRRVGMIQPPGEAARKHILSITPGIDDGIWVATEGAGVFQFDGNSWRAAPPIPGVQSTENSPIWMAQDGRLWVDASSGSGLYTLTGERWRRVASLARVATGRGALLMESNVLWAVNSQGLFRFSGPDFKQADRIPGEGGICALAPDGKGGIWFGGYGTGLGHWGEKGGAMWHSKNGLPNDNVHSLFRTDDGTLWIGTDGAGLVRMKNGRFGVISKKNGLPSNSVCQIIDDGQGRLWMGTRNGICAVSFEELDRCADGKRDYIRCVVLDTSDGMEVQECSAGKQPSVCRTADGRLWFATQRGVAVISPSQIDVDTQALPVWIEQLHTDAGSVSLQDSKEQQIRLPQGQRRIQIEFDAPCLPAAHRVRFKHRLEPIESGWVDSESSREATYARVPPGKYVFRVIASNKDGVWNEQGATLAFTIPPFLWERAWFAPLCWFGVLGTVAALVLVFLRQRLHRRVELLEHHRAVERERSRIAKDLHDDLGGSLTEINMLAGAIAVPQNPDGAEPEIVGQIARKSTRMVRALDEIVWAVNPKHDSVASLVDYLSGASQEFLSAAGIRLRLDVPRTLPEIALSPEQRHDLFLTAKEALNNVVRHSRATEARVQVRVDAARLVIVVADDGCGFDTAISTGGDGLNNMRERAERLGGFGRISSQPGEGTTVEIEMPLK
ncbi:MAG: two-component regulator propeller domain-containing protein [Verrucomicrobiota bacterium]